MKFIKKQNSIIPTNEKICPLITLRKLSIGMPTIKEKSAQTIL